jgi:hypothetical protein
VQLLQIHRRCTGRDISAENARRPGQQLVLPIHNLICVHIVQLSQLGQRLLALDGVDRHLGLEKR